MNIVCFEIENWESGTLQEACCGVKECNMVKTPLSLDNIDHYASAEIISCFIYSDLSRSILEKIPNLKLIATRSTGTDHIDLEYCNSMGIAVANVPSYGEHTVAEHVFALLLGLSRHISQATHRTREGDFSFAGLQGFDLFGKTIGIIGTGAIGRHVAQIAKAFGMSVLAYDIDPRTNADLSYVDLKELLSQSDVISLHIPDTSQTRNMLSEKEFSFMKDGVVIINTARGSVIDVKALFGALKSGKVGAAGLDVLPEEPVIREEAELLRESFSQQHDLETLLTDYVLLHQKNVIVTPHSAFYTKEAVAKILQVTAQNIVAFMAGKPQNIVNTSQIDKRKVMQ
ncbi:MAG: hydroxyacid dehydrogenase [Micavibrio sp.]|nr:hydroxyacid dehydrogenase [Micavibrio sp.]